MLICKLNYGGLGEGKQGLLRDLSVVLWCCEGIAQHSGRHVGITRGGGSREAHPPCLP